MRKGIIFVVVLLILAVVVFIGDKMMNKNEFQLTSSDIKPHQMLANAQVYNAHGCSGQNISPQLSWAYAPQGTKSFAIVCHDPDAPRENGWYHWLVVNIPAEVHSIAAGGHIKGALETLTSFNEKAYGGACPPVGHGVHRYNFTVYALDVDSLDVKADSNPLEVEKVIQAHALGQATLTGLYER